jgi:tetratricopeptide (TPR) repeat protein
MRPARLLCLLLPLFLQTGCTVFTSYKQGETQINQWIKDQQYGKALQSLGDIAPTDPDYSIAAKKRKQVEALAASYEHDVRQKNVRLLKTGKWAAALDSYDDALDRLPDSAVLKDGMAQLHQEQVQELERLELKRLFGYGAWLKEVLPVFDDLVRVDPRSSEAKERQKRVRREADSLANELTQYGNRALANNQLDTAEKLLKLAADLSDTPAIQESLKNLKQQRRENKQQQVVLELKRKRITDNLLKKFNKSFRNKHFPRAHKLLDALGDAGYNSVDYRTLQKKLQQATDREARRLMREGVNAYSRGQFEQAVKSWQQVLVLQPDNKQAKESLQRAEKVLERLKELRIKQTAE